MSATAANTRACPLLGHFSGLGVGVHDFGNGASSEQRRHTLLIRRRYGFVVRGKKKKKNGVRRTVPSRLFSHRADGVQEKFKGIVRCGQEASDGCLAQLQM